MFTAGEKMQRFYKLHTLKEVTGLCVEYFADMFCMGNDAQARGLMLPQKTDERIDLVQFQVRAEHVHVVVVVGVVMAVVRCRQRPC